MVRHDSIPRQLSAAWVRRVPLLPLHFFEESAVQHLRADSGAELWVAVIGPAKAGPKAPGSMSWMVNSRASFGSEPRVAEFGSKAEADAYALSVATTWARANSYPVDLRRAPLPVFTRISVVAGCCGGLVFALLVGIGLAVAGASPESIPEPQRWVLAGIVLLIGWAIGLGVYYALRAHRFSTIRNQCLARYAPD